MSLMKQQTALLYEKECYQIQGAIFEVYKEVGPGFLESVYQECLEMELANRNIPFVAQSELRLSYKGIYLQHTYKADLICFSSILIELKAAKELAPEHLAQMVHYLKVTGIRLGLLVNFSAVPRVVIKRIAC